MSYKKTNTKKTRVRQTFLPQIKKTSSRIKKAVKKAKANQPGTNVAPNAAAFPGELQTDKQGYFALFRSKSSPNKPPYVTRYWTTRSGRFSPGDISCNCPGFIYNKKCHHTSKDLPRLLRQEGII